METIMKVSVCTLHFARKRLSEHRASSVPWQMSWNHWLWRRFLSRKVERIRLWYLIVDGRFQASMLGFFPKPFHHFWSHTFVRYCQHSCLYNSTCWRLLSSSVWQKSSYKQHFVILSALVLCIYNKLKHVTSVLFDGTYLVCKKIEKKNMNYSFEFPFAFSHTFNCCFI